MKKSELKKIIKEELWKYIHNFRNTYIPKQQSSTLNEGATNLTTLISGNPTQVQKKFDKMQDQDRRMYGDDPYGGSWAGFSGIRFINKEFAGGKKGQREADDWILDNQEKWGPAFAVKIGKTRWLVGGWVAT